MGRLGRLYRLFRYFHNIDNIGVIELQRLNPIMQKLIVLVPLATMLTFVSSSTAAQSLIDGHWEGVMVREGSELTVSFDFSAEASGIRGSFNSPALHALRIPLRNVTYNAPNVHFLLVGDFTTIIFDGQLSATTITGQFREGVNRDGQFREGDARGGVFHEGERSLPRKIRSNRS